MIATTLILISSRGGWPAVTLRELWRVWSRSPGLRMSRSPT